MVPSGRRGARRGGVSEGSGEEGKGGVGGEGGTLASGLVDVVEFGDL